MSKPKFDPTQPYQVIDSAQLASKPKFDPSQPFEPVASIEIPQNKKSSYMGDVVKNIPSSAVNTLNDYVVQPIVHPIKTVRGMADLATGVAGRAAQGTADVANLLQGKGTKPIAGGAFEEDIKKAEMAGGYIKDRYGSGKAIKESFRKDPAGIITDFAMLAQGGGAGLKASKIANVAKIGQILGKTGEMANPVIWTAKGTAKATGALAKGLTTSLPETLKNTSARLINSVIKPLKKDFAYGKNAGEGVVREGIVGKSFEDMMSKISQKTNELGNQILDVVTKPENNTKLIDNTNIVGKLDKAIAEANRSPKTNSALIQRIENAKSDIIGERDITQMTPAATFELKKQISDITKWTGNASDDAIVNKALKQTYGQLKENLNKAIPELADLNERFANMKTADIAIKYRDKILQRQNAIGVLPKITFGGGALTSLATGNPMGVIGGAALAGAELLARSTPFKSAAAQGLYKTGKGIERAAIGAKKIGQILNKPFNPVIKPEMASFLQRGSVNLGRGEPKKIGDILKPEPALDGEGIPGFTKSLEGAMQHRPTKGPPANNLLAKVDGDDFAPKDIYEHPEWYANGDGSLADRQSIAAIRSLRGSPNAMVTIYRASPKNELRTGDWVSLSKDYAKGESLSEGTKVNSFRVKASDVNWAGDSLNEFGYFGKPITQNPKNLIKLLETEGAYIQKHGKIPPNADMAGFKKSKEYLKYGTTERQQASAYYEYIENKLNEIKLSPKPAEGRGK